MRVHFIAIGGSAMHNLAIALHKKGYEVSGSDDNIFEPSRSRLEKYGLLPKKYGWYKSKINFGINLFVKSDCTQNLDKISLKNFQFLLNL